MIRIRSNLNGPIEFSVKSGKINIMRSKIQGKPEFLTEITKKQYDELVADKTGPFKDLLKSGDFQVIKDHEEDQEDSGNKAFSMEELEAHAILILKEYKEGEGAELLQTSLSELQGKFEFKYSEKIRSELEKEKTAWEIESKTKKDEAVKSAVNEVKTGLIKKHNSEKKDGKITVWK